MNGGADVYTALVLFLGKKQRKEKEKENLKVEELELYPEQSKVILYLLELIPFSAKTGACTAHVLFFCPLWEVAIGMDSGSSAYQAPGSLRLWLHGTWSKAHEQACLWLAD